MTTILKKSIQLASYVGLAALLSACGSKKSDLSDYTVALYEPQYASGFEILGADGMQSVIITTSKPWQGANERGTTKLFIARNGETPPNGFDGQILADSARRIVCMSSSYVAMLDAIGDVQAVVGVSGSDFITNDYISSHRDLIGDVGYEGNVDYEKLLALQPDLVLLYGVSGASSMEGKLAELEIPYAYIGEYLEESPLGKAEWLVVLAEMVGKRAVGEMVFAEIPLRYNALKERVNSYSASARPKVMINAPYGDSWVMASTASYVARLIADAAGNYVYGKNTASTSLAIDTEEAYRLASESDVWINVGSAGTLKEFKAMVPNFAEIPCVKSGHVYNNNLRVNSSGGNDYWESGVVHPELVLRDLVKIFHPEAVEDYDFTYYKQLK